MPTQPGTAAFRSTGKQGGSSRFALPQQTSKSQQPRGQAHQWKLKTAEQIVPQALRENSAERRSHGGKAPNPFDPENRVNPLTQSLGQRSGPDLQILSAGTRVANGSLQKAPTQHSRDPSRTSGFSGMRANSRLLHDRSDQQIVENGR